MSLVTIKTLFSYFWPIYYLTPQLLSDRYSHSVIQVINVSKCWVQWESLTLVIPVPLRHLTLSVCTPWFPPASQIIWPLLPTQGLQFLASSFKVVPPRFESLSPTYTWFFAERTCLSRYLCYPDFLLSNPNTTLTLHIQTVFEHVVTKVTQKLQRAAPVLFGSIWACLFNHFNVNVIWKAVAIEQCPERKKYVGNTQQPVWKYLAQVSHQWEALPLSSLPTHTRFFFCFSVIRARTQEKCLTHPFSYLTLVLFTLPPQ